MDDDTRSAAQEAIKTDLRSEVVRHEDDDDYARGYYDGWHNALDAVVEILINASRST